MSMSLPKPRTNWSPIIWLIVLILVIPIGYYIVCVTRDLQRGGNDGSGKATQVPVAIDPQDKPKDGAPQVASNQTETTKQTQSAVPNQGGGTPVASQIPPLSGGAI